MIDKQKNIEVISEMITIIKSLLFYRDLSSEVIAHCSKALQVLEIMYNFDAYGHPKDVLLGKDFDKYFESFPFEDIRERENIDLKLVLVNMRLSIMHDDVLRSRKNTE